MPQIIGQRSALQLSADVAVTANTVLANVTGLALTIGANTRWILRYRLPFSLGGTAPGFKFQITVPSGGSYFLQNHVVIDDSPAVVNEGSFTASTSLGNTLANAGNHVIDVYLVVWNGSTAGTINFQWAQNVSDAAATTLLKGGSVDILQTQ